MSEVVLALDLMTVRKFGPRCISLSCVISVLRCFPIMLGVVAVRSEECSALKSPMM